MHSNLKIFVSFLSPHTLYGIIDNVVEYFYMHIMIVPK